MPAISEDCDGSAWHSAFAEAAAIKNAAAITLWLGIAKGQRLRRNRNLTQDELLDILDSAGAWSSAPHGDTESFIESDLIIEATDDEGETCYIAVEASHTCDARDTDRAIAHAELLERFTKKRAYPAIAGIRRDERILHIIDSGEVFWYALKAPELRPE